MKTRILKLSTLLLLFIVLSASCQKDDDLPPNHAKGKIIEITGGCYGEIVLIEVENPKGIGLSGTFSYPGEEDEKITYENAIGIPYFSKIGIPDSVPQAVGIWLYFEYRNITNAEKEDLYYSSNPPLICPANIISPSNAPFIITKIISYK